MSYAHDIALVRLSRSLSINNYVRPVCLATSVDDYLDDALACYISGWGSISEYDVIIMQRRCYARHVPHGVSMQLKKVFNKIVKKKRLSETKSTVYQSYCV